MKHTFFLTDAEFDAFSDAIMKVWESGFFGSRPEVTSQQKVTNGTIVCLEASDQDFALIMMKTGVFLARLELV